jgi:hypothetical protein
MDQTPNVPVRVYQPHEWRKMVRDNDEDLQNSSHVRPSKKTSPSACCVPVNESEHLRWEIHSTAKVRAILTIRLTLGALCEM